MYTSILSLALIATALISLEAFSPSNSASRTAIGQSRSTIVMDGKTRVLRDRMKSVKNTRRITEAMRLVAAARVRRAQDAVLKTRPLIAQLQLVCVYLFYLRLEINKRITFIFKGI